MSESRGIPTVLFAVAAWLIISSNGVAQQFTPFQLPPGSRAFDITMGADGALWITEYNANKIGRLSASGELTEFPVPTPNAGPGDITLGPDGNVWFVERNVPKVGRVTPQGQITEFSLPAGSVPLGGITSGPDGHVWLTIWRPSPECRKIGKISPSGIVTEFPLPDCAPPGPPLSDARTPNKITAGPDGNLWYTRGWSTIGRISVLGEVTEFYMHEGIPWDIKTGADGNLWFTQLAGDIGRITPAGVITQFQRPNPASEARQITLGADASLYFTDTPTATIGRISPAGVVSEFSIPDRASRPYGITLGPGGHIWFTDSVADRVWKLVTTPCSIDANTVCLQSRFTVRLTWRPSGSTTSTAATAIPLTRETGAFWFYGPANFEVMVKIIDGREINGHFWVFFGSLTNLEFTLSIFDTDTGATRTYTNPQGDLRSAADTTAFRP